MQSAEKEARRALSRLRRALEKARREIDAMRGALQKAEGEDFPYDEYAEADNRLAEIGDWLNGEEGRLRAKVLQAGGLEAGRVRRSSGFLGGSR